MPYSGWPITKAELVPYYKRAQKACNLGPYEYDFAYWEDACTPATSGLPFLGEIAYLWQIIRRHVLVRLTEQKLSRRNIDTYLHANVVEIDTNDTAQAVTRLCVASLEGKVLGLRKVLFWPSAELRTHACC